jgi:hypothetical protein
MSWGEMSWGKMSWGELSWGELSWGELSWGEWSGNQVYLLSALFMTDPDDFRSFSNISTSTKTLKSLFLKQLDLGWS